jgi:hypothetical protein
MGRLRLCLSLRTGIAISAAPWLRAVHGSLLGHGLGQAREFVSGQALSCLFSSAVVPYESRLSSSLLSLFGTWWLVR